MPKIEVPTFDDLRKDWETLFDLIKGTVQYHPTLRKVQKPYYLNGVLRGEAKGIFSLIPTTESIFDAALKLLQDRHNSSTFKKRFPTCIEKRIPGRISETVWRFQGGIGFECLRHRHGKL